MSPMFWLACKTVVVEFQRDHAKGAINMPLDQLMTQAGRWETGRPVLVCCASGTRSALAARLLRDRGFESYNADSWSNPRKTAFRLSWIV